MSSLKTIITIQDLFGVWQTVEETIASRLRQESFTWQSGGRPPGQCSLESQFQAYKSETDQSTAPCDILLDPSLNIFVVQCDSSTAYKDRVKQLISNWHGTIKQRQPNQEYIILHVASTTSTYGTSGFASKAPNLSARGSVLDKFRNDFSNSEDSINRCFQLRTGDDRIAMENAYTDLISGILDGVRRSLTSKVVMVESSLDELRSHPITSPGAFKQLFLARDRLAHLFEAMTLTDEALSQYLQISEHFGTAEVVLEAMYFREGKAEEWSVLSIGLDLFITRLRERGSNLLDGSHSTLEFRLYIFAAIIRLFVEAKDFEEALSTGLGFVSTFDRLSSNVIFGESKAQTISSLIDWILTFVPNDHYTSVFAAYRGDLCHYKLLLVGQSDDFHEDGLKPAELQQSTEPCEDQSRQINRVRKGYSSEDMRGSIEQVLADYKFGNRKNTALLLELDCVSRSRAGDAQVSTSKLHDLALSMSGLQPWSSIYDKQIDCMLKYLSQVEDSPIKAQIAVDLLLDMKGDKETVAASARVDCFDKIFETMVDTIELSLQDVAHFSMNCQTVECRVPAGLVIEVTFESFLPFAYRSGMVQLELRAGNGQIHKLTAVDCLLKPGRNQIYLSTQDSFTGDCMLHAFSTSWGKICFSQRFSDTQRITVRLNTVFAPLSVDFPRFTRSTIPEALEVCLRTVDFEIYSCFLNISIPHTMLKAASRVICHRQSCTEEAFFIDSTLDGFALRDQEKNSRTWLELPYQVLGDMTETNFEVELQLKFCYNGSHHSIYQQFMCDLELPLAVNVQEIFRSQSLFSRYHVTCGPMACVRVDIALITKDGESATTSFGPKSQKSLIASSSYSYLTQIPISVLLSGQSVVLCMKYRSVGQELRNRVISTMHDMARKAKSADDPTYITSRVLESLLVSVDFARTAYQKKIVFHDTHQNSSPELIAALQPELRESALTALLEAVSCLRHGDEIGRQFEKEYSLELPVELPAQLAVHSVDINILEKHCCVGKPVQVQVSITTTFECPPKQLQHADCFSYALEADEGSWLMAGKAQGRFCGKGSHTIEINLVPLHVGLLNYPSVSIHALGSSIIRSEIHVKTSAKVVTVL